MENIDFLSHRYFVNNEFSLEEFQKDLHLPRGAKVMVALSGGVDSSFTTMLLKKLGYDVSAITLKIQGHHPINNSFEDNVIAGARAVCDYLEVKHYVANLSDDFYSKVMKPFAESYVKGETPIPCSRCNRNIKLGAMFDMAMEHGAEYMVTGHYIRWLPPIDGDDVPSIVRAEDKTKDQTYFLGQVEAEKLNRVRFPLGHMKKKMVRYVAGQFNLPVAEKPDSLGICFVPEGDYKVIVNAFSPDSAKVGDIVHVDGRVLGQHEGLSGYTVGQRRGLAIGGGDPLYVVRFDVEKNQVIVGDKSDLECSNVKLESFNWLTRSDSIINQAISDSGLKVFAKVRSSQNLSPALLRIAGETAILDFDDDIFGVAKGQLCAIYDINSLEGIERILGSGYII